MTIDYKMGLIECLPAGLEYNYWYFVELLSLGEKYTLEIPMKEVHMAVDLVQASNIDPKLAIVTPASDKATHAEVYLSFRGAQKAVDSVPWIDSHNQKITAELSTINNDVTPFTGDFRIDLKRRVLVSSKNYSALADEFGLKFVPLEK